MKRFQGKCEAFVHGNTLNEVTLTDTGTGMTTARFLLSEFHGQDIVVTVEPAAEHARRTEALTSVLAKAGLWCADHPNAECAPHVREHIATLREAEGL